jgi:hypothetical protein
VRQRVELLDPHDRGVVAAWIVLGQLVAGGGQLPVDLAGTEQERRDTRGRSVLVPEPGVVDDLAEPALREVVHG